MGIGDCPRDRLSDARNAEGQEPAVQACLPGPFQCLERPLGMFFAEHTGLRCRTQVERGQRGPQRHAL